MNINIDELKSTTQAAINAAEERRQKKLAEIKAKDEREAKKALLKAEGIIAQIPDRCAKEAEQGRSHAIVMSMSYSECSKIHNPIESSVKGAAAHVWNACREAELNPTIEHWHDGGGMRGGYNIVVHWEADEIDAGSVDCPPQLRE